MTEKNGKIKCLECGKYYKRVCCHVRQIHQITARDYKKIHGLDVKRGILTEADRKNMRERTLENGTVENLKKGIATRYTLGHKRNYKRSKQTLERLRHHGRYILSQNKKRHELF